MMDTQEVASMYAQIVNGGSKEASRFVTDDESGALWDQISSEVEQMRADDPNIVFSIPNEMPDPADDAESPAEDQSGDETEPPAQPEQQPAADAEGPAEDQPGDETEPPPEKPADNPTA